MSTKNYLNITITKPTPLLKDFNCFINYIENHNILLTPKNEHLSGNDLFELNKKMTEPKKDNTIRTHQKFYPILHFFYHLLLSGKLFKKVPGNKSRLTLEETKRLKLFNKLTNVEQYFFLLETFWVDIDWNEIKSDYYEPLPFHEVEEVLLAIGMQKPNEKIMFGKRRERSYVGALMDRWEHFILYFSYFGFWNITRVKTKEERSPKDHVQVKSITPLPFGIIIAPVLGKTRRLINWNLPLRRNYGELDVEPGSPSMFEDMYEDLGFNKKQSFLKEDEIKVDKWKSGDLFFSSFTHLFKKGELEKTIPREKKKIIDGTFVFKVSLPGRIWRRIEISSKHTLLDFHNCIQRAFNFDDDHLYSFFMDNKAWSRNCFVSPYDEEGPHVDKVRIRQLDLYVGQKILYLFDYGSSWYFQVKLEEIKENDSKLKHPRIIKKKGEAPNQYYDDEEYYLE